MKKISKILILVIMVISLSGCINDDELLNDYVYTTIYPVKYLADYLYGDNKEILSIYPSGADVFNYNLTEKQKDTYSSGALFIYNGLTSEKGIAKEFLNRHKEILLIDVSYGLNYKYSLEELWLSPNNYLMLAKNLKNNLIDYTNSKVLIDSINKTYEKLEEELSYMDADLRDIAKTSKSNNRNVLVVSSDKLKFLENYGFTVIVLNKENDNSIIEENFKNGNYKDIYLCNTEIKSDFIAELESKYSANVINVDMLYTLSGENIKANENYLTIMQDLIDNIRNTTLS